MATSQVLVVVASQAQHRTCCHELEQCLLTTQVFHYTRQEVFQLLCESADPQSGLAAAKDNKDSDSITRCDHIKEKIIVPWLQFKTGTLLIVSGFCNNELKEQLADLDTFQGYIERSISASDQHPDPGSDYCKLAAYLRFNTVLGHPLLVHALEKADFNKKDIGKLCFSGGISPQLYLVDFKCLLWPQVSNNRPLLDTKQL